MHAPYVSRHVCRGKRASATREILQKSRKGSGGVFCTTDKYRASYDLHDIHDNIM